MLRTVLAVLLGVALLAAAAPVVEDARERRTADLAAAELSRVSERATGLAARDAATADGAARRVLRVSVPDGGPATAALDYAAVGGVPGCGSPRDTAAGDVVAYRLRGGDPQVATLPVDLRAVTDGRVRDDGTPLVVRGDARLTLTLVAADGATRVRVRRTGAPRPPDADGGGRGA